MPEVQVTVTTMNSPWLAVLPLVEVPVVGAVVIVVWRAWRRRSMRGAGR